LPIVNLYTKIRKQRTDVVGRLVEVIEDPIIPNHLTGLNYITNYIYDTMNNLTNVTQGGQTRTFVYDSLG